MVLDGAATLTARGRSILLARSAIVFVPFGTHYALHSGVTPALSKIDQYPGTAPYRLEVGKGGSRGSPTGKISASAPPKGVHMFESALPATKSNAVQLAVVITLVLAVLPGATWYFTRL